MNVRKVIDQHVAKGGIVDSQIIVELLGLEIRMITLSGYVRTKDYFQYTTSTGYVGVSTNITLILERYDFDIEIKNLPPQPLF